MSASQLREAVVRRIDEQIETLATQLIEKVHLDLADMRRLQGSIGGLKLAKTILHDEYRNFG